MTRERLVLGTIMIGGVLTLLATAVWYGSRPKTTSLPVELTRPDPNIDRSRIPLGPYTVDFSGLMGGPTGDNYVSFYVVMRPDDVHFQRTGEVGKETEGASVVGLDIKYSSIAVHSKKEVAVGWPVDGLKLLTAETGERPRFIVQNTSDASGGPIKVTCSLFEDDRKILDANRSFLGIRHGMCTAKFWLTPYLHVSMGGIQPNMFGTMSIFLPKLLSETKKRIHGEP